MEKNKTTKRAEKYSNGQSGKLLLMHVSALRSLNPFDHPPAEDLQVLVSTYRRCCEAPEAPEAPGAVSSGWVAEQKEALSSQHLAFSGRGGGERLRREEAVGRE